MQSRVKQSFRYLGITLLGASIAACGGGGGGSAASDDSEPYSELTSEVEFEQTPGTPDANVVTGSNAGEFLGDYLMDPVFNGDRAYIPTGADGEGISVVDVSDLDNPVILDPIVVATVSGLQPRDLAIKDNVIFAVNGTELTSVSIASGLVLDAVQDGTQYDATSIEIVGNVAYVTGGSIGPADPSIVRTFNIADPADIQLMDSLDIVTGPVTWGGRSLVIDPATNQAFVAAYEDGICVLDVADPSDLSEVGCFERLVDNELKRANENANRVALDENGILYVLNSGDHYSVDAYDVSTPGLIGLVGTYQLSYETPLNFEYLSMQVVEDVLLLGTLDSVAVINIADAASARFLSDVANIGADAPVTGLGWLNGYLFVTEPINLAIHNIAGEG